MSYISKIDINCDMGESYGRFKIGNDEAIFPFITSCNIACGYHGGDPLVIEETIQNALKHKVQIGAHPSYPDLSGFGRRGMDIAKDELCALIKYQIAALKGMTESCGGKLAYVKPHGALYNATASKREEAMAVIEAIREIDGTLAVMGLAGSVIEEIAKEEMIPFIGEAFADRKYTSDGKLMSRRITGSVIYDPEEAAQQVLSIVIKNQVVSDDDVTVNLNAQSICIHGDNPSAVAILQAIDRALIEKNINKERFSI